MPFVEVETGVRYFYEDRGEGKPIVFVHGWGMSGEVWEGQAVAFSDEYRVITLDCRGCGKSDKPKSGYEISALSNDLRNFLKALNLDDVTLVGWSAGGSIVMDYITRFGDYVTKVVSVGGAVPRYTNTIDFELGAPAEAVEATISALKTNRYPLLRGICDACYHSKDTDASVKEWNFRIFTQHSWFVDQTMEDLGKIDLRDKLPHINIPVALFHGRHDQVVPYTLSEYSAQQIPGAKLVTFENSSHTPFYEESQRFNEELLSFINE